MKLLSALFAFAIAGSLNAVQAQATVVDLAAGSKEHTTLVAAVKAAGLVEALQSPGPFTVFAPVDAAFENLPKGTVETLLKAENRNLLTQILTYHVLAGSFDAASVIKAVKEGGGKAEVKTLSGGMLTLSIRDGSVIITDEKGGMAKVVAADLKAGNGIVHVIDSVVLPK